MNLLVLCSLPYVSVVTRMALPLGVRWLLAESFGAAGPPASCHMTSCPVFGDILAQHGWEQEHGSKAPWGLGWNGHKLLLFQFTLWRNRLFTFWWEELQSRWRMTWIQEGVECVAIFAVCSIDRALYVTSLTLTTTQKVKAEFYRGSNWNPGVLIHIQQGMQLMSDRISTGTSIYPSPLNCRGGWY